VMTELVMSLKLEGEMLKETIIEKAKEKNARTAHNEDHQTQSSILESDNSIPRSLEHQSQEIKADSMI
jgi:hypothetical protein